MNKIFLTSAVCMGVACPAMAVVTSNSDTCNDTNLGTASGTASLEAIWGLNDYNCSAGQYFDASTATCVQCTSNNYCPGGTYNVESQTNGLNACPNGYGLSVAGASADTDCYRTCTTGDVAHSLAVSGGYYYDNNNRCEPTSCAAGWHVKSGIDFTNSANVPSNPTNSAWAGVNLNGSGRDGTSEYTRTYYGINANGTWGATFTDFGDIRGSAYCSAKSGNNHTSQYGGDSSDWTATTGELSTASGEAGNCWCQIDGVRPTGSGSWENLSPTSWVFLGRSSEVSLCPGNCAVNCAQDVLNSSAKRNALFGILGTTLASCEANDITINWYNGATLHDTNQCTYNETITLPEQPNKTGYTFNGWKIKAVPSNNN